MKQCREAQQTPFAHSSFGEEHKLTNITLSADENSQLKRGDTQNTCQLANPGFEAGWTD